MRARVDLVLLVKCSNPEGLVLALSLLLRRFVVVDVDHGRVMRCGVVVVAVTGVLVGAFGHLSGNEEPVGRGRGL